MRWGRKLLALVLVALAILVAVNYEPDRSLDELSEYLNDASAFVDIDGQSVHYRREGTPGAPTLVLLHGNSASLHTWDGWVDALSDSFELIRMDLPAFGLTGPSPDGDYRTSAYVRFLHRFVDALALDQFALAGNSLGGNIAWQFALEQPQRVTQLILIDPSGMPAPEAEIPFVFRLARVPVISGMFTRFAPESLYRESLLEVYADDSLVTDALVKRYRDLSLFEGNRKAFIESGGQREPAPIARLGEIATPTLIMWGEQDLWIPPSDALRFESAMPNAERILYPTLGHLPMEEAPQRTAADAKAFLLATDSATTP
jgi:pimeloyl-ACP methyl ester carboxylesterase